MSYAADMLDDALTEDVPLVAGEGPGYAARKPQDHVFTYGTQPKPFPHHGERMGAAEPVGLQLGANVIVRTKAGVQVAEGWIEEVLGEARVVRVRDQSSGTDFQIDVDPDRYDIWVKDTGVMGDAPRPEQKTNYTRPSRPGPHKGAVGNRGAF